MFTQAELERIEELFEEIEGRKSHEYAAPTYRDSPALQEMATILLSYGEDTIAVLEEKLPALWYLAGCYDRMCRWGMSVKYYALLLATHVALMDRRPYSAEDMAYLEDGFYSAIKARNQYGEDICTDWMELIGDRLSAEKKRALRDAAIESRRGLPRYDPVEITEEYLSVIDEVEALIAENSRVGICHEYWSLKADYLAERGIRWRSPALLNPGVLFD